ncbi:MAG TPA: TIGR02678 family protein, partial [Anaerovoracaceae bacterium]|nr:TIGR02678 family protein [Anaerovoracaceae bacterium]
DKELYHKVKREIPKYRRFVMEQLGWRLINNERIIKLEKIPAHAESFMGIDDFSDGRDYCILCAVLMFLEDKEDNEQFLLSELIDMLEAQLTEYMEVDWTKFVQRKSLVRALQFAEKMGMLVVYDGSSDSISEGIGHEVLYENTGLSRYFATSFGYDVKGFQSYRDFETKQPEEVESDRGHFRINRVYRQLVSSPAMYWKETDDQDSIYVKNQRQWVQKNLDDHLGGQLHIHKNAAFFVMEEDSCFGDRHPRDAMLPEIVLIVCEEIRNRVKEGIWTKGYDECVQIGENQFKDLLAECKAKYGSAWSKEYREMDAARVMESVVRYMKNWMLLSDRDEVIILPAAGKLIGKYPKDFKIEGAE